MIDESVPLILGLMFMVFGVVLVVVFSRAVSKGGVDDDADSASPYFMTPAIPASTTMTVAAMNASNKKAEPLES